MHYPNLELEILLIFFLILYANMPIIFLFICWIAFFHFIRYFSWLLLWISWVLYIISILIKLSFNIWRTLINLKFLSFISFVLEVIEVDNCSIEDDILLKPFSKSEYSFERSILFSHLFLYSLISGFKSYFFDKNIFIIYLSRWILELIFWF